ncbi:hypothetical protein BS50DRAFT_487046 [Corynespora cassiicola Philippines]|uniref:Protein AF-9 homolog n=1 Tax=Corynespora cassiicola Philippines TaxID=1448308 RepID=A0A2T2P1K2_CORCC|nr:hypothetical protein BS50DRAFT_487046 [Corynespora cassiicola Philippines]
MAENAPESVQHDDLCPICQMLLFAPVRTQCNHLLCASCMTQWADVSSTTNLAHASLDFDLRDFDANYDPIRDLEANCPMCRTHTAASLDDELAKQLEERYPVTWAERKVEEETARGGRVGQNGVEGIMILIGNKHQIDIGEATNIHDWTFFVRTSRPDVVKEVRVNLHPTFRPPRLVLRKPPFEVHRYGWGTFNIEATIILKAPYRWVREATDEPEYALSLDWTLDFGGRGGQGRIRAKIQKQEEIEEIEEMDSDGPRRSRRLRSQARTREADSARAASPVNWPHMDDSE